MSTKQKQKTITIYRAVPKGVRSFRTDDYVTLSIKWATGHARHVADVDEEPAYVLVAKVPENEVAPAFNPGEFRYVGAPRKGTVVRTIQPSH